MVPSQLHSHYNHCPSFSLLSEELVKAAEHQLNHAEIQWGSKVLLSRIVLWMNGGIFRGLQKPIAFP